MEWAENTPCFSDGEWPCFYRSRILLGRNEGPWMNNLHKNALNFFFFMKSLPDILTL
jgi:hypothetical protein